MCVYVLSENSSSSIESCIRHRNFLYLPTCCVRFEYVRTDEIRWLLRQRLFCKRCEETLLFLPKKLQPLCPFPEFGIDRSAVPPGVQHVFPGRIRRGRTCPVHAVDGILHARGLRLGSGGGKMVRLLGIGRDVLCDRKR